MVVVVVVTGGLARMPVLVLVLVRVVGGCARWWGATVDRSGVVATSNA